YADITTRAYGLGFFYEKLDYKLNPRKGISFSLNGSAGSRLIKKNAKLNEIIYNGVKLNTSQYQGEVEVFGYIPLFKKATIKLGTQAATVISDQVFKNELFRIGGLKTLRGFDEESIFASTYAIGTFEYRYLLDENSAVFLFSDAAIYEKSFVGGYLKDIPYGVGAGMSFETKAGIFSLSYALGKQFNNPLDIRSGKIHFGIVNAF
ncbi:MAG: BamA/TamA family outer membrane protein, partial [Bacteroidia bacterium]|nr:BamA/TamA family outer membrane protein [Bacteroidia bacterium]